MNRRGFLTSLLKVGAAAAVAPTILPAASTYVRRWKRPRLILYPYQLAILGSISDCKIQMLTPAELEALFLPTNFESYCNTPPEVLAAQDEMNRRLTTFIDSRKSSLYSFLHGL